MEKSTKRLMILAIALSALMLLLVLAPALAKGGDYGVNTGASASNSNCGGTGQPACTLNWNGYGLTFSHAQGVYHVYDFDDLRCTVYIHSGTGAVSFRGDQCSQYQSSS